MTRPPATPSNAEVPRTHRVDRYYLVLALGYGLYRVLMDLAYSSTMSGAQALTPLGGPDIAFALVTVLSFALTAVPLAILGIRNPRLRLRGAGIAAIVALGAINLGSGLGIFDDVPATVLPVLLSVAYGVTSNVGNIAWLVSFAELGPKRCLLLLVSSILLGSLGTLALGFLPSGPLVYALSLVSAASAALFWSLDKTTVGSQAVASPQAASDNDGLPDAPATPREAWHRIGKLFGELWGPLVIYASLTILSGFVSSFFSSAGDVLAGYITSIAASLLVAVLAFVAKRTIDLRKTFRAVFPCIGLLLIGLPFLGPVYSTVFCSTLQFLSSVVNVSFLFLLLETARMRNAPKVAAVALVMFVTRLGLFASMAAGNILGSHSALDSLVKTFVMTAVSLYFLSMALMMLSRHRNARNEDASAPLPADVDPVATEPATEPPTEPNPGQALHIEDALEVRSYEIAKRYHLSPREREVALLIAHGRTAAYIGSQLMLSTNTVRGYVQELYAKIGVHSKQELIDLFQ